jgi:hypothetical protein
VLEFYAERLHYDNLSLFKSIKKQTLGMNLNITYFLDQHGWSTCIFYIDEKRYELDITHIYPNHPPIECCMEALISIMKGKKESEFYWYGEPGGEKMILKEIKTKKNCLLLTAINCDGPYEDPAAENEIYFQVEVSKKIFITFFFYEFKKISVLMQDKEYEKHRKGEFPFKLFKEFELKASNYLGLN